MQRRSTGTLGLARRGALALAGMALALALLASGTPTTAAAAGRTLLCGASACGPTATSTPLGVPPATSTPAPTPTFTPAPTATATPAPAAKLPAPAAIPTPPPTPTTASTCPIQPTQTSPIHFCAPVYAALGEAAGPNGTRVTVIGAYAAQPIPPDAFYFVAAGATLPDSSPVLTACATPGAVAASVAAASAQYFPVMCAQDIANAAMAAPPVPGTPFVWSFTLAAPAGAAHQAYFLAAIYPGADAQTPQRFQSTDTFEVLSATASCVVVVPTSDQSAAGGTCPAQDPIILPPGSTPSLTLQGANWLPAGQIAVEVTAVCVVGSPCSQPSFLLGAVSPANDPGQGDDGSFRVAATIPANVSGHYAIRAWSVATSSAQAAASGALAVGPAPFLWTPTVAIAGCAGAGCTLAPGATLAISGQSWAPSSPRVYLVRSPARCTGSSDVGLPAGIAMRDADGTIHAQLALTGLEDGATYRICVDTVAANTLVTIRSSDAAQTVAWLALALALASLGLYVVLRPRRGGFAPR
ncbi:MAG TPA: hypothetical protein VIG30_16740 [Ktedonobacterales bacterium]